MPKEKIEPKGGASAIARKLAKHFFDTTGYKCTEAEFKRNLGSIKALLIAEYTEEQIKDAIDWCIKHKPEVIALGYVTKCINDLLFKVKIEKINAEIRAQDPLLFYHRETTIENEEENTNKNKIKSKRMVKGTDFNGRY